MIVDSIARQYQKNLNITYFIDKLRTLEIISYQCGCSGKAVVNFCSLLRNLLDQPYPINIICNSYNPLRLIIICIKLMRTLDKVVRSMSGEIKILEDSLVDVAIEIIDNINSISSLRNWLYDDVDEELKVIDYFANFDLIRLLNLPKVSQISLFIWQGIYDMGGSEVLTNSVKSSVFGQIYRSLDVNLDSFLTIIGREKLGNFIRFSIYIAYSCANRSYLTLVNKNTSDDFIFSNRNKTKSGGFSFKSFTNSIRTHFVADGVSLLAVLTLFMIYFVLWVQSSRSMIETNSNILALSSQTQTDSVISQTNNFYSSLQSTGENWFTYLRALVIISVFSSSFIVQDLMIILTYFARKISINALSKNTLILFFIDLAHSVLAIYLLIKFVAYYNIDRTLSRSEEKYYRMLLEIETNKLQPMHCFLYFICAFMFRVFYYLIYFDEYGFGVIIQIIVKMAIKVIRFLIIYFTIILMFSFVGYGLFYDIEEYSTLIKSFNTTFKSSLGGFDYNLYDNSSKSSSTTGRIYLSIYLLLSSILLLNFLIAILSDTYSEYINNGSGLQSKEMIKARILYEKNDSYQCLAKTTILLNFYMLFMAPFVIIFKSKKLNKIILHLEFGMIFVFGLFFVIAGVILYIPLFIIIIIFIKLGYSFSPKYSQGILDKIVRLIDICAFIAISPIISFIYCIACIAVCPANQYEENYLQMVECDKFEFEAINRLMDSSLIKNNSWCPYKDQRKYMIFKSFYSNKNKLTTLYDPSNRMISESIVYVMVATLKNLKIKIQRKFGNRSIDDSIPIYMPTNLVIKEFADYMLLSEHFKTIIFGIQNKSKRKFDEAKIVSLAKTLASKTINDFICENDFFRNYNDSHNGVNMINELAGCSYKTRLNAWLQKLKNFLLKSNAHWLINQFQYCKILMFNNSYDMNVTKIPEYLFDAIPYLSKFKLNDVKTSDEQIEWNEKEKSGKNDLVDK